MPGALIQIRRNTSVQWEALNPILRPGEQGLELDTRRVRIGDGQTHFMDLDYFLPSEAILALIEEALADVVTNPDSGGGDSEAVQAALDAHLASLTPHAVYDDGPSLLLLYQNAKV